MEPDDTQPLELTAKDHAKVQALIDPQPLPCGGVGLVDGTPRTTRWSFGRRSTAAVARAHLGYGWPVGILRRSCPSGDRCLTHRTDDTAVVPGQLPLVPDNPRNTVTSASERPSTAPGGKGVAGGGRADEAVLRGWTWATGAAGDDDGDPYPEARSEGPSGLAPGPAPHLAPGALTSGATGTNPPTPERGRGVEDTTGAGATAGAETPPPGVARTRRRKARPLAARTRGRVARTVAAAAAVCALVFTVDRCTAFVSDIDPPTINPGTTSPAEAPTTPDPLLPPDTTIPPSGPTFTLPEPCTPSHCPSLD